MATPSNRHPVDELADLRAQMSRLEGRADYLRRTILAGDCDLHGDEHVAVIRTTTRTVLDAKAIRRELGDAAMRPFMSERKADQVFIRDRKDEPKPLDLSPVEEEF